MPRTPRSRSASVRRSGARSARALPILAPSSKSDRRRPRAICACCASNAPPQRWWHHDTLNFHLHFERQERPYGTVDFVIETMRQPDDEDRYAGRYLLSLAVAPAGSDIIDPPLAFRGDVVCTAN